MAPLNTLRQDRYRPAKNGSKKPDQPKPKILGNACAPTLVDRT